MRSTERIPLAPGRSRSSTDSIWTRATVRWSTGRSESMGTERNIRVAALALALLAPACIAQTYQAPPDKGARGRAAMLASLQRGKELTVRGVRYRHLPEVLAVERASGAALPGEVIESKGRLVLYRAGAASAPAVQRAAGRAAYPAVLNTQ